MKTEFDYNEFDSLSLALKADVAEKMLEYYKAFGWEEYEKREDSRYFDIVHIKLIRRHKIANKDRLQLLQVKMEAAVNRFAIVRKHKHSRSVIIALTLGVLALLLCALGVGLILAGGHIALVSLGGAAILAALASPILIVPLTKRSVRREREAYASRFKEMTANIARILSSAKKLYGGENERDEK